jgi:hypothetical protein
MATKYTTRVNLLSSALVAFPARITEWLFDNRSALESREAAMTKRTQSKPTPSSAKPARAAQKRGNVPD